MTRKPRISGKRLLRALEYGGFENVRTKGSHHFMRHSDGRCTVIVVHGSEIIGIGLLTQVMNDTELTTEQLEELLKNT